MQEEAEAELPNKVPRAINQAAARISKKVDSIIAELNEGEMIPDQ